MLVKKPDGSVVDYKREMASPDLVLEIIDTESLLNNAQMLAARMLGAMQRTTRAHNYQVDPHDSKILKELVDVTMTIDAHKQKQASTDALALLPEEELKEKLRALAAKMLG